MSKYNCEVCQGKRYQPFILKIKPLVKSYKGCYTCKGTGKQQHRPDLKGDGWYVIEES